MCNTETLTLNKKNLPLEISCFAKNSILYLIRYQGHSTQVRSKVNHAHLSLFPVVPRYADMERLEDTDSSIWRLSPPYACGYQQPPSGGY